MTSREALTLGSRSLYAHGSGTLDAELLLAHVLGCSRSTLLAHPGERLSLPQQLRYRWYLWRRSRGVPVGYLVGYREFYGRSFRVTRATLIPRPDTETLIEAALKIIRENSSITTVADIGTGSGCIAITLALEVPALKVLATDISQPALTVALGNARSHGVAERTTLLHGDLLTPIITQGKGAHGTLIVANLPYLAESEVGGELLYEPRHALESGALGLGHYQRLLEQVAAMPVDQQPDTLLLETHPPTAEQLKLIAKNILPSCQAELTPDLTGKPRVLALRLAQN